MFSAHQLAARKCWDFSTTAHWSEGGWVDQTDGENESVKVKPRGVAKVERGNQGQAKKFSCLEDFLKKQLFIRMQIPEIIHDNKLQADH